MRNQLNAEDLTVGATALGLTAAKAANARHALIYVGAQPIRLRADGTLPTSTTGMPVAAGQHIDWTDPMGDYSSLIERVRFIRDTSAAGDATLSVAYFD